jgi:hypothetical protein
MKASVFFYAIVLAFLLWLITALWTGASGAEPSETTTGPEPTPPPPTTVTVPNPIESTQVRGLKRKLAATRKARRRDQHRYRRALQATIHSPLSGEHWLERAFSCIHSGEGRWSDPNPPYWGGLQMDRNFMQAYMPWAYRYFGTADRWPVSVQIAAGIHAVTSGRGFYPWPNTARVCGLIR